MGSLVLAWFFHVNYWYYHQAHMLALAQWVQGYCGAVTFFSRLSFSLRVLHVSVHHQRLSLGISGIFAIVWGQPDPMKWVSCFHEQQDSQVSTKSPLQSGEDAGETLNHLTGLKRATQESGMDFWQGHGVIG